MAAAFAAAPTPVKLCENIDVFAGSSNVKPGGTALFAIFVSSAGANSTGVSVTLTTSPTAATPHFAVCPSGHTKTCKINTLANSQVFELQAAVVVPKASTNGEHVKLTAKLTATKPSASVTTSATVTATVSATANARFGEHHSGPRDRHRGPARRIFPDRARWGHHHHPGGSIGSLLPSIPAATPGPVAQSAAGAGAAAPVANIGPLDRRLMGTQLIALAALCAAIGIVIARFTLRTPRPVVVAGKSSGSGAAATGAAAGLVAGQGGSGTGGPDLGDAQAKDGSAAKDGPQAKDAGDDLDSSTADRSAADNSAAKDSAAKDSAAKDSPPAHDGADANGAAASHDADIPHSGAI